MTTQYYIYETQENDRWDLIAMKFYGNCYDIEDLIKTNFHIPILPTIEANLELIIPVKETTTSNTPDWKKD